MIRPGDMPDAHPSATDQKCRSHLWYQHIVVTQQPQVTCIGNVVFEFLCKSTYTSYRWWAVDMRRAAAAYVLYICAICQHRKW